METIKRRTACFTGHRHIPADELAAITAKLERLLRKLIADGYLFFATGGALGFDTLAAQMVLKLQREFSEIKLCLVLPCLSQTRGWSKEDVEVYEEIKTAADKVIFTDYEYTKGCMFKRNRTLVDISNVCVCFLRQPTGGTAYTVKYARAKNIQIISI